MGRKSYGSYDNISRVMFEGLPLKSEVFAGIVLCVALLLVPVPISEVRDLDMEICCCSLTTNCSMACATRAVGRYNNTV